MARDWQFHEHIPKETQTLFQVRKYFASNVEFTKIIRSSETKPIFNQSSASENGCVVQPLSGKLLLFAVCDFLHLFQVPRCADCQ